MIIISITAIAMFLDEVSKILVIGGYTTRKYKMSSAKKETAP
jgi:hypothetical protein